MLVERGDAELEQVAGIEVIMGRMFEQFAPGLLDHEVVVRGGADVVRLADVADPGILLAYAAADVFGAIASRRCPR